MSIFIVALAQAMLELGHRVQIVVGAFESREKFQRLLSPRTELPIIGLSRTPLSGPASVAAWLRAMGIINRFRPDLVIHSEAVPLPLQGTVVQIVHDLERRQGALAAVWRAIRRMSMRRCHYVVASTTELQEELVRDLGLPGDQILRIPKCIDQQSYACRGLASRERAILHAGTSPYKVPEATIGAFGALNDPSVRLYVTGDVTRPVEEAVEALPEPIKGRVVLLGMTTGARVRDLHSRVRVAAFPTRYTVPVASATVMEAIATGTPIVGSSRLSRDVLADGVNGVVAEPQAEAMAATLKSVLDDDDLWLRLSAGARQRVRHFDADRVAKQYLELAGTSEPKGTDEPRRVPARRSSAALSAVPLPVLQTLVTAGAML
ncbi:glycosyltransferase family 4 protein [Sinorhizobium glycinis]|uniref:glycosyltransferase family 4 protein n=1 Tax=Sinorhizobium glycinis TaxID=1472378 RepID=UPI0013903585|nr:glycosyltransferase family 4 protein [Sinorhizobium glycinis]